MLRTLALTLTLGLVATAADAATVVPGATAYAQYDYYRFGLGTYDATCAWMEMARRP